MILRVGLTGGIASGKSTIARNFARLGCTVVDADTLVAELYQPGARGHAALVGMYGASVLRDDRSIDRGRLSAIAFSSDAEAHRLNALIHPMVMEEAERRVFDLERDSPGDHIAVLEATLLLEALAEHDFDRIVVVDVPVDVQVQRATGRGMDREEALRRMEHQMPRDERLRHADYVIDNSGTPDDGREETRRVFNALRQDLEIKKRR